MPSWANADRYTDPETGLQYDQARYYDPTTGQFLTRDPVEEFTRQPYTYTNGNPTNWTDPSGLWFGVDDLVASGVGALVGGGLSAAEQLAGGNFSLTKTLASAGAGAAGAEASLYGGPVCGGPVAGGAGDLAVTIQVVD